MPDIKGNLPFKLNVTSVALFVLSVYVAARVAGFVQAKVAQATTKATS